MIDTRDKRASVLGLALAALVVTPLPDATISQSDRQHIAWTYSGISSAPVVLATADYVIRVSADDLVVRVPGEPLVQVSSDAIVIQVAADDIVIRVPADPSPVVV